MSIAAPGHDEVVLAAPGGSSLCNSRACAQAGTLAEVIVTCGVLNDPGASLYSREALWREAWRKPVPMCGACWESSRQVAVRYRPGLVVITTVGLAPAVPQAAGGRA